MRSVFLIAALVALANAGPASTSRIKGNPNEANYDPMAKGASYMYPYVHGQDIRGHHASSHHHTLYLSEADATMAAEDAMEEENIELPENCGEDAAIDCAAKFVEAGCPAEYEDAECADYAACNADPSLCAEVVMAEGEENAAAMGLASGIRCDPAGRGSIGPDGECICNEGTRVVVVGVIGVTMLYDTAATTTEYGNAMPAYNTCIPDVANSPRTMPGSKKIGHESGWDAPPGGSTWGPGKTSYGPAKTYSRPGQIDRSDPYNGRRPSNPQDGGRIDSRPQEAEEEPAQEEAAEVPACCDDEELECTEEEVCPEAEEAAEDAEATASVAAMVAATLLAAASL